MRKAALVVLYIVVALLFCCATTLCEISVYDVYDPNRWAMLDGDGARRVHWRACSDLDAAVWLRALPNFCDHPVAP
jgi:hypothetical protein